MLKFFRLFINIIFYGLLIWALLLVYPESGSIAFFFTPIIIGFTLVFVWPLKLVISKRIKRTEITPRKKSQKNIPSANKSSSKSKIKLEVLYILFALTAACWLFIIFALKGLDRDAAFPVGYILAGIQVIYTIYFAITY